jgi:hypothetical protein
MSKPVLAKFVTRYGDVFWGPVEPFNDASPVTAKLEQYVGDFRYDHDDNEGPVYRELEAPR